MDNVPKLIGTQIRQKPKVDGVLGFAGLVLGVYDGVSGLVTEPIKGHKQEVGSLCNDDVWSSPLCSFQGSYGAVKGFGRGRE
jgi:hypothetical protein